MILMTRHAWADSSARATAVTGKTGRALRQQTIGSQVAAKRRGMTLCAVDSPMRRVGERRMGQPLSTHRRRRHRQLSLTPNHQVAEGALGLDHLLRQQQSARVRSDGRMGGEDSANFISGLVHDFTAAGVRGHDESIH